MRFKKATTSIYHSVATSGYRLTLYMGLNSDSGPDYPVLLTSVNDLYRYFNTSSDDQSFHFAEFCLGLGYNVYAKRVNRIIGNSSSRKFIVDGRSYFYSPLRDVYPEEKPLIVVSSKPTSSAVISDTTYSAILNFPEYSDVSKNVLVSPNFLLIVPRTISVGGSNLIVYERLIGSGVSSQDLLTYSGTNGHDVRLSSSFSYGQFKDEVLNVLQGQCGIEVTHVTCTSVYIQSKCPLQSFYIKDATVLDTRPLLEFKPSNTGEQDNYCNLYDEFKVCTLTSKYPDSLDDIEVQITKSLDQYLVYVTRSDANGSVIYSESFAYGTSEGDVNFISKLSDESEVVSIAIHDYTKDLSGTYKLLGKEKIEFDSMFTDSLTEEDEESDLAIDIAVDTSYGQFYSYLNRLKQTFKNSLVFTGKDFIVQDQTTYIRTCIVCPDVEWRTFGYTLPGPSYLFYILPEYSAGSDSYVIKKDPGPQVHSEYCSTIVQSDYEVELMGTNVALTDIKSRFPIKAAISIVAVINYLIHTSVRTESEFVDSVGDIVSSVNRLLGTWTRVTIDSLNKLNYVLYATLSFYVDKQIILSYRVSAKLVD